MTINTNKDHKKRKETAKYQNRQMHKNKNSKLIRNANKKKTNKRGSLLTHSLLLQFFRSPLYNNARIRS